MTPPSWQRRLAASWSARRGVRLFEASEPGFGFVDERTPELGIGVEPRHRGEGIGRALLEALVASAREAGYSALSLGVEEENPAVRLYERVGFERHARGDRVCTVVLPLA